MFAPLRTGAILLLGGRRSTRMRHTGLWRAISDCSVALRHEPRRPPASFLRELCGSADSTWETAKGAFLVGGRWSSAGRRVIHTSLDPSTAIVEAGLHKRFDTLDTVAHTLREIEIRDPARVHVMDLAVIPDPYWRQPAP